MTKGWRPLKNFSPQSGPLPDGCKGATMELVDGVYLILAVTETKTYTLSKSGGEWVEVPRR